MGDKRFYLSFQSLPHLLTRMFFTSRSSTQGATKSMRFNSATTHSSNSSLSSQITSDKVPSYGVSENYDFWDAVTLDRIRNTFSITYVGRCHPCSPQHLFLFRHLNFLVMGHFLLSLPLYRRNFRFETPNR